MSSNANFKWWSLGGLGEVGMNCMVMQFGNFAVPIDAGILFAGPNDYGIDSLHPDYATLLKDYSPEYWLITHAHEDHIGAVSGIFEACRKLKLQKAPRILAPPFAAELIREKSLDDRGVGTFKEYLDCIENVEMDSWIRLNSELKVRFIEGRHSTVDSCSLAFEWQSPREKILRVLHSSDYKIDTHSFEDGVISPEKYQVFDDNSPDILFLDSTNSEREGRSVSETEIYQGLLNLTRKATGRIYVSLFSSNVYRIALLAKLGAELGRKVCLAGRSLQTAYRIASNLSIIGSKTPSNQNVSFVSLESINRYPPSEQFIICSGSQGENRSALMKLAQENHAELRLDPEDTVILSSKMIPGNEKSISRLINNLLRQGARVFWGEGGKAAAGGFPLHASGHARRDELRDLIRALKPYSLVPVHGELRQLMSCAEVAREVFSEYDNHDGEVIVVENGQRLEFESVGQGVRQKSPIANGWRLRHKETLPDSGRILRFETFTSPSRDPFLWVRKQAALNGVVSVVLNKRGEVSVKVSGIFPEHIEFSQGEIEKWVASKFKEIKSLRDVDSQAQSELENEMSEELERFMKRITGLKPYCHFHIMP
jgi:ribonuclease J